MVALYLTSLERGSGKTTVAAGLGKHWRDNGQKIGFFKPIIADSKHPPNKAPDSDAAFMKHLFALEEPIELICPVLSNESNLSSQIKEAYARVSAGKNVVIVEGISEQSQASRTIVEALPARVIIVESYSQELLKAINSYQDFGGNLLGIVWNKVPRNRLEHMRAETSTRFSQSGITILGILPEDRTLLAPTIGELAEHIPGELLTGAEKAGELVENLMLGAMVVDHGPEYFGRKANKAVVVRSERPDMQLAALETSTRCLVLTGNTAPIPAVLQRAAEKEVPIILARAHITTVVANIEGALGKTRFNQPQKLPRLTELMGQYFDFPTVDKGLF